VNKENERFRMTRRPVGYISNLMRNNLSQKPQTAVVAPAQQNTFGKANRPSTPIQGVISFTYANMAEQEIHDKYEVVSKMVKDSRRVQPTPGNTRARELARQHIMSEQEKKLASQERFKLKRFTKVEAKTLTHRI
jgi:hypothetical protein